MVGEPCLYRTPPDALSITEVRQSRLHGFRFRPTGELRIFPQVAELALEFKEHLESFGYHPFVKTTGRKGLHVVAPVEARWTFDKVFEAAKAVATPFVESHGTSTTLHIKKEYRKGRVLVDIYRNRAYQTIVAAYSVRGLQGATVSMPISWDRLQSVRSLSEFDIRTVPELVVHEGDAWEGIDTRIRRLFIQSERRRCM